MNYKAVIFDLDGTLLDTIDDLADSMNFVLDRFQYPTHAVEKYKYFVGDGMLTLVKRALPQEVCTEETAVQCLEAMREEYAQRWADKSKPYKGIPELLDALQAKGIKINILSNKPHEFTQEVVKKLLPDWNFEIIFGERKGIPKKPDPAGALEICSLLGLKPEQVLYLGDTNTDMITANAAGMHAVGVTWGFRPAEELLEHGAKVLIDAPEELLSLL